MSECKPGSLHASEKSKESVKQQHTHVRCEGPEGGDLSLAALSQTQAQPVALKEDSLDETPV